MPLETLIERWFAIGLLVFGLSHVLYPARWAAVFLPLRERDTGGFLLGLFYCPVGLFVVLAHNVWVAGIPVIVTVMGWITLIKGAVYLLVPGALSLVMPTGRQMERAFRVAGAISILLGGLLVYDWISKHS